MQFQRRGYSLSITLLVRISLQASRIFGIRFVPQSSHYAVVSNLPFPFGFETEKRLEAIYHCSFGRSIPFSNQNADNCALNWSMLSVGWLFKNQPIFAPLVSAHCCALNQISFFFNRAIKTLLPAVSGQWSRFFKSLIFIEDRRCAWNTFFRYCCWNGDPSHIFPHLQCLAAGPKHTPTLA